RSSAFFTSGRSIVSVANDSERSTLILIHALSRFAPEAARLHVLCEQRTRAVFLPQAAVQVFQDAEPRVEADEIDELERAHGVIETELQCLVDVARGGHTFHRHVARLGADACVYSR